MRQITITLSSEKYGREEFIYTTEGDALAGLIRLYKQCKEYYKKDKVERSLTIKIGGK
jgi:hypothetical protein